MTSTIDQEQLDTIKSRQQATWGSGDYAQIGSTLQIVGELLCEAAGIEAGMSVLDVAAGNGNAAIAAIRRNADVLATDYVPELLAGAAARAAALGLPLETQTADAEQLPFADEAFDAVLSVFGVMFTPRQQQAASELQRVVRRGGHIGVASWTPDSFIGDLFRTIGRFVPPPPVPSVFHWGDAAALRELFGADVEFTTTETRTFTFRYRSAEHFVDTFRAYYGPTHRAFAALEATPDKQSELYCELVALCRAANVSQAGTLAVPSTYLEAVAVRR